MGKTKNKSGSSLKEERKIQRYDLDKEVQKKKERKKADEATGTARMSQTGRKREGHRAGRHSWAGTTPGHLFFS